MLTATQIKSLADRLAKAEQLVATAAVKPVAGCDDYFVVTNGDGTQVYLVRLDIGHEHCSCPDFTARQGPADQPCKHLLASQLFAQAPKPTTPKAKAAKVETAAVVEEPRPKVNGAAALARLQGDDEDYSFPVRAA